MAEADTTTSCEPGCTTDQAIDPVEAAHLAGLYYISDKRPGIKRVKRGRGFTYIGVDGRPVTDLTTKARIKSLAIPPAWTEVWISPIERGHIQATGRDEKGRKQYRYHPRWREVRDEAKYGRAVAFAKALPRIRSQVEHDLSLPGLPSDKVLATIVRLLETTHIRVGNEEYARTNRSYGLTTLRNRHVSVSGSFMRFKFRGKSGKEHTIGLRDRHLARVVARLQELPGQELFQYIDDEGHRQSVDSSDVNSYLREITGEGFTAKDFRTWAGTVLAAKALAKIGTADSKTQARKNVVQAIHEVSQRLGNTPAICRKCYVHPAVLDAYMDGSLDPAMQATAGKELGERPADLPPEEAVVVHLIEDRLDQQAQLPETSSRSA